MSLDKAKKVLTKARQASDELVPTGAVLAWSNANGENLSWAELTEALEYLIALAQPKVELVPEPEKKKKDAE